MLSLLHLRQPTRGLPSMTTMRRVLLHPLLWQWLQWQLRLLLPLLHATHTRHCRLEVRRIRCWLESRSFHILMYSLMSVHNAQEQCTASIVSAMRLCRLLLVSASDSLSISSPLDGSTTVKANIELPAILAVAST